MGKSLPAVSVTLLLGVLLCCGSGGPCRAADRVDVALVIAVDVSGSISPEELGLQRNGYAQAFRSRQIMRAVGSGETGRIAVTYVEWGGPGTQRIALPWTVIATEDDAGRFAARLLALPPKEEKRASASTSISSLLIFCGRLFGAELAFDAARRVIDVSGNGPNNAGPPVLSARDAVIARDITINGLAIEIHPDSRRGKGPARPNQLKTYFESCVIGGPGAFAVGIGDVAEMEQAILRKLVGEIVARAPLLIRTSAAEGPLSMLDCLNPGQTPGR